jgi:hypothetical protein
MKDFEFEAESSRRKLAVIRRCPAPLTMMVTVLAMSLGSRPISTQADTVNSGSSASTATYTLTSSAGLPVPGADISGPQVEALVLPPGGVVPPTSSSGTQQSPLTILSGSNGFDASQLVVALKNTTSSTGTPEQMFGLVFFGQGLAAGGVLNFSLTTESSLTSPPVLESLTPGVTITLDSVSSSATSSGSSASADVGGGQKVPEPLSLLIWSALAGAGLWRVHARQRRSRRVAL